jgi:hypothetical protein
VFDQPIPEDKPLRLGLSVEVAINVSNTRGPLLSSLVQRTFEHGGSVTPNESLNEAPLPELEQPSTRPEPLPSQHGQFFPQPNPHGQP